MALIVRPVVDERDGLLAYLAQQREALRIAAHGLSDEQAASRPTTSALTIAGLLKHVTRAEPGWAGRIAPRNPPEPRHQGGDFELEEGETLSGLLDLYAVAAAETEAIIAEIADLGRAVPVPRGRSWVPEDVQEWSVRWVLLHLIQETARHAGHADIIRESIDGATSFELMAATEAGQPTGG